jgi:signal transduction histidine kinase
MASKISTKPRGEIGELTASLQSLCTAGKRSDKELREQKREVFKKAVHYLTIGALVKERKQLFFSKQVCARARVNILITRP